MILNHPTSRRGLARGIATAAAALVLATTSASAALRTHGATWTGRFCGNDAFAVGKVVMDDALRNKGAAVGELGRHETVVRVGSSISVDGVTREVRSVVRPAALRAAAFCTRVGAERAIAFPLITTDGIRVVKTFVVERDRP
jgi:hypothetical protein